MGFNTHIVFSTAEKCAFKAFEIGTSEHIVKPFSERKLKSTVDSFFKGLQDSWINEKIYGFMKNNLPKKGINKIAVWSDNSIKLLDTETILYFTVEGKKVIVNTKSNSYESNSSLSELEEKLEHKGFFRCHKSFLINTDYIEKIDPWVNSTFMIKLEQSDIQIPVSRFYTKKLKELLEI